MGTHTQCPTGPGGVIGFIPPFPCGDIGGMPPGPSGGGTFTGPKGPVEFILPGPDGTGNAKGLIIVSSLEEIFRAYLLLVIVKYTT